MLEKYQLLGLCMGAGLPLLTLITIFGRLRCSLLNCFNSRRVEPELVLYIKTVKIGLGFENEQPRLYLLYFSTSYIFCLNSISSISLGNMLLITIRRSNYLIQGCLKSTQSR